jgi:hypothetical protein
MKARPVQLDSIGPRLAPRHSEYQSPRSTPSVTDVDGFVTPSCTIATSSDWPKLIQLKRTITGTKGRGGSARPLRAG